MQQQASVLFPNGPDNTQFLKLLKSDTILFKQAIEKKSIICVPPDAYFSRAMTKYKPQQLLKWHILNESPLFLGTFVTADGLFNLSETELRVQKKAVKVLSQIDVFKFQTTVLKEDTFYTNDFKAFKVWLIDKCIVQNADELEKEVTAALKNATTTTSITPAKPKHVLALQEANEFLQQFPQALSQVQSFASQFIATTKLVIGFEHIAVDKIHQTCTTLANVCLEKFNDPDQSYLVKSALYGHVLATVYKPLFAYWKQNYREKDIKYFGSANMLQSKKQVDFGIPSNLHCDHMASVGILQELDSCDTVIAKLYCIKRVSDSIMKSLEHVQKYEKQKQAITSDEYIPVLTFVLVHAKLNTLASNEEFISQFLFDEVMNNELGFGFVSLQAAIQNMLTEARKAGYKEEMVVMPVESANKTLTSTKSMPESQIKQQLTRTKSVHSNNKEQSEKTLKRSASVLVSPNKVASPQAEQQVAPPQKASTSSFWSLFTRKVDTPAVAAAQQQPKPAASPTITPAEPAPPKTFKPKTKEEEQVGDLLLSMIDQ